MILFSNPLISLLTIFVQIYILLEHCIPRLCNGSTSDSGSDCGGSNPPWGTKLNEKFSFFFIICIWPLRITASTADSHSVNRSSILLGANRNNSKRVLIVGTLFYLTKKFRGESNSVVSGTQKGEQCGAFLSIGRQEVDQSERRRGGGSKHDVCDQNPSILLGDNKKASINGSLFISKNYSTKVYIDSIYSS